MSTVWSLQINYKKPHISFDFKLVVESDLEKPVAGICEPKHDISIWYNVNNNNYYVQDSY